MMKWSPGNTPGASWAAFYLCLSCAGPAGGGHVPAEVLVVVFPELGGCVPDGQADRVPAGQADRVPAGQAGFVPAGYAEQVLQC